MHKVIEIREYYGKASFTGTKWEAPMRKFDESDAEPLIEDALAVARLLVEELETLADPECYSDTNSRRSQIQNVIESKEAFFKALNAACNYCKRGS